MLSRLTLTAPGEKRLNRGSILARALPTRSSMRPARRFELASLFVASFRRSYHKKETKKKNKNETGVTMKRRRVSRKGSRRLFTRTAKKTKKKNVLLNLPRGGIQL